MTPDQFLCRLLDATTLPRTRPLYRRIVTLLESAISRGAVNAGFRLPPERDLASRLKISRATVVSAASTSFDERSSSCVASSRSIRATEP